MDIKALSFTAALVAGAFCAGSASAQVVTISPGYGYAPNYGYAYAPPAYAAPAPDYGAPAYTDESDYVDSGYAYAPTRRYVTPGYASTATRVCWRDSFGFRRCR